VEASVPRGTKGRDSQSEEKCGHPATAREKKSKNGVGRHRFPGVENKTKDADKINRTSVKRVARCAKEI